VSEPGPTQPPEPATEPATESATEPARPAEAARPVGPPEAVQVRLRRAPRYRAFLVAGGVVGAIAGVVASLLLGDPESLFSQTTTTGYLAAIGLLLGALLGGAVAVLVERPRR
jgi:hypothetical protein